MYEIEVKFQFPNQTLEEIKQKLSLKIFSWSKPKVQNDTVFLSKNKTSYKIVEGDKIFRIRQEFFDGEQQGITSILALKIQQAQKLVSQEYETEFADVNQMTSILESLELVKFVNVIKKRSKAKFENYNLCLDEVQDLGVFLEVELLSEKQIDFDVAQVQIVEFVKTLDLPDFVVNMTPYDTQIFNKKGLPK